MFIPPNVISNALTEPTNGHGFSVNKWKNRIEIILLIKVIVVLTFISLLV
jgi:hypothetical protein